MLADYYDKSINKIKFIKFIYFDACIAKEPVTITSKFIIAEG